MKRKIVGAVLLSLAGITIAAIASAFQVDNYANGPFDINISNDSKIYWASGDFIPWGGGTLETDVAQNGTWSSPSITVANGSYSSTPQTTISGNVVNTQLIFNTGSTSGVFNADPMVDSVSITLVGHLKFTWTGSPSCVTPDFTVTLTTSQTCSWCGSPAIYNYDSNGAFKVVAGNLKIAAPTGGCGGTGNINSLSVAYVLDNSTNHDMIIYGRVNTPEKLAGSP